MYFKSLSTLFTTLLLTAHTSGVDGRSAQVYITAPNHRADGAKFSYTGMSGPLGWAGLSANHANEACSVSNAQSPINLDAQIKFARANPRVEIPDMLYAVLENLGTTLEVARLVGTTRFEGKAFELLQFHFHTPSEHRIEEEYFPLEVHFVHQAEDGTKLVLGAVFQLAVDGTTTELLTAVTKNIVSVSPPGSYASTGPLHFQPLIAHFERTPLFRYNGSLTTPPCTSGVTWLVAQNPLNLNVATYNALKKVMKFNARYTQNAPGEKNLIMVAASQLPR